MNRTAEHLPGRRQAELRIGTSGWHYKDWWGPFFPDTIRKKDALRYYASQFDAAELNAPFYRTPTMEAVQGWHDQTPEHFRFSWKASKFITHWRRLLSAEQSVALLEERLGPLQEKAGPVLFQLPPKMQADRERLAAFLAILNPARRYSFEFRHPSWYEPSIFRLLGDFDVSLCLSDHAAAPAPIERTASWIYVRNHGPGGRYHGTYSDQALGGWAQHINGWIDEGRDVWCFFDNDVKSAAPADATRLLRLAARPHGRHARQEPERPAAPGSLPATGCG